MLFMGNCGGLEEVVTFIKSIVQIIQIAVPVMLIVMGIVDLGKAVLSSDDKEIKGATSKLVKRAIAAVAVFFVPLIVNLLIGLTGKGNAACWNDPNGTETNSNGGNEG